MDSRHDCLSFALYVYVRNDNRSSKLVKLIAPGSLDMDDDSSLIKKACRGWVTACADGSRCGYIGGDIVSAAQRVDIGIDMDR